MLSHARELLFGDATSSATSKQEAANKVLLARPAAPPTPKVKRHKLRALNSESCRQAGDETTIGQSGQHESSVANFEAKQQRQTVPTTSANSSASSGYLSGAMRPICVDSITTTGESINQDYNNNNGQFHDARSTASNKNGLLYAANADAEFLSPNNNRHHHQHLQHHHGRWVESVANPSWALAALGRRLDAGQRRPASSLMTVSHESERRRRSHADARTQRRQATLPMVPMLIDDEEQENENDVKNYDDDHQYDARGEIDAVADKIRPDLCQFEPISHVDQYDDDDELTALNVDQQQQQQRYFQHYHHTGLIDGHLRRQNLSWRQRQAHNLAGEARQHQLELQQQNSDEQDGLDSCSAELSAESQFLHQQQRTPAHRSYANTKRMLIIAGQLNNQPQFYKQQPFDFSHCEPFQDSGSYQEQQQVFYQAHTPDERTLDDHELPSPRPAQLRHLVQQKKYHTGAMQARKLHQSSQQQKQHADQAHQAHQQVKRSKSAQPQQRHTQPHTLSPPIDQQQTDSNFKLQQARILAKSASSHAMAQKQHHPKADSTRRRPSKGIDRRTELALGCCAKLAKLLLFMTNAMFWSAGIALGVWGILALVDDHKYNLSQLLVFDHSTRMSLFQLLSWSFITLGCSTILVGFCGCSALFKNSRWILGLYIFLILAIFALDLATGLLAIIFQERLVANVRLRLANKLRNEYGIQASFTAAIDYIQTRYECCGLEGHLDYDQSLWRLQRLGGFEATVARTCCHLRNTFDDQAHVNPRPVNESMCQSNDVRFHQSYRYRRGCLDDLERLIRHKIWTFTIGCGAVGAVILLSLLFATCFCRSIPSAGGSRKSSSSQTRSISADQQIASLSYLVEAANNGNQIGAKQKQSHSVSQYRCYYNGLHI